MPAPADDDLWGYEQIWRDLLVCNIVIGQIARICSCVISQLMHICVIPVCPPSVGPLPLWRSSITVEVKAPQPCHQFSDTSQPGL